MVFSDEYLMLPWVIFNRQDAGFILRIEDLNGKMVSVPNGYVMQGLLEKNYPEIRLKLFSQGNAVEQCLAALATGEVDAYIGNLAVGSYIILKNGYTNLRVAAPTPFGPHNQAMAIRDDWPELAGIINKTLQSFTPEVHAAIRNKWLSVRYEHGIRPKDVAIWLIGIAGILMAVIMFVVFWNRSLTREISECRRVEKELQNSENRYRSLCNASFEGVLIIDDGLIIEANDVMARILGYTIPELIGKEAVEIVAGQSHEKYVDICFSLCHLILDHYPTRKMAYGIKCWGFDFRAFFTVIRSKSKA